jgi:hypothetical protein
MNATSVGFMANREKIDFGDPQKGEPYATFKDVELLEISLVSIPANPEALISSKAFEEAIENDIVDELEIKDLQEFLKEYLEEKQAVETDEKKVDDKIAGDNINTSEHSCEGCGKVLKNLCPDCLENKDNEDYFEKLYSDILKERKEVSA